MMATGIQASSILKRRTTIMSKGFTIGAAQDCDKPGKGG